MKKLSFLAFLLLSQTNFAQKPFSKVLKDTPGVVSFTFRNDFSKDVAGTLDYIKEMGIRNIEFSNLFGKTATEMRALLDARGMVCTSYGVYYDALTNKTEKVIEDAKTLGVEFVRVGMIPHKGEFTVQQADAAIKDFNRVGKILKENGLEFSYHNHGYDFTPHEKGTLYDYLIQNTNPKYVSFELDILWVHQFGQDPLAYLKKYPARFKLMHVKDLKKGVPVGLDVKTSPENDVPLGSGQINVKAILKQARKSAIKYYYLEDENSNSKAQVPLSLGYLKTL
ncbi:sugar phosphate isomerase/epimerase family protein [Aquirufa sp. A-Brett2-15D]